MEKIKGHSEGKSMSERKTIFFKIFRKVVIFARKPDWLFSNASFMYILFLGNYFT